MPIHQYVFIQNLHKEATLEAAKKYYAPKLLAQMDVQIAAINKAYHAAKLAGNTPQAMQQAMRQATAADFGGTQHQLQ